MKKQIYFFAALLMTVLWYSCKKADRIDHIDRNAPAPAQISDVKVEAKPGGAILTYKIPKDSNLSYVKAVYEIQPGVFREAKSSIYMDTLVLVGYGDTLTHEVKLYSVGKNEKASESVSITIKPLTPSIISVFETLDFKATFGGVNVGFKNSSQANLAIVVIVDTSGQNTWAPVTTFYTGAKVGNFSARGYDSIKMKFGVYIRDRWNNKSDTLIKSLTPLYEQLINSASFRAVHLPTDSWEAAEPSVYALEYLWDGVWNNSYLNSFASLGSSISPTWFTIDFGKKVSLSRLKEYQMNSQPHIYGGAAVESFEIWGSNDPDADGGWTHWELFEKFNSFKPSGLPMGQVTAEDVNYAAASGEDFNFTVSPPPVRYIRFKTLKTYGSSGQIFICELRFWGQIIP
jgi:hypothetical protein